MLVKGLLSLAALLTSVALAGAAPAPGLMPEEPVWGKPVNGLRLGLRPVRTEGGKARLMAVLENVGDSDLVLHLGILLANGKRQVPAMVRLTFTGPDGKARTLVRKIAGVAGRVDPFVVPLPAGCRYELACDLEQFGCADWAPAPGRYQVAAEFVGEAPSRPNPDVAGLALMPYWTGTIRSGEVRLTVPAKRE